MNRDVRDDMKLCKTDSLGKKGFAFSGAVWLLASQRLIAAAAKENHEGGISLNKIWAMQFDAASN